jgi:uncharacterized protein (DUF2236 family)
MPTKLLVWGVPTLACLLLIGGVETAFAQQVQPSHADRISVYEGPQTCRACHPDTFKDVAVSLHYQQMAEPQFLVGWPKGELAGQAWSF